MTRSYCAPSALTETAIATVIQYSISKPNSDDRDADRISVDYGFSVGQKTRLRYFPLGQWSMSALGQKQTCATHKLRTIFSFDRFTALASPSAFSWF
jgi:hypothetical protein